jgi:hypothetical protein
MTAEHGLSCKMGGLVHIWDNDVADEWRHLCATAFFPCRVGCKPRILSSVSCRVGTAASNTTPPSSSTPTTGTPQPPTITEERGDPSCHGFWEHGLTCIFDMRITDMDAKSYQKKEPTKVLRVRSGRGWASCFVQQGVVVGLASPCKCSCLQKRWTTRSQTIGVGSQDR